MAALPYWEYGLMLHLGIASEDDYLAIPKRTRARMIVRMNLDRWLSNLDYWEWKKEQGRGN